MSWPPLATMLSLGLLVVGSSAVDVDDDVPWWYPVAGVLQVYGWNGEFSDLTVNPPHASIGHRPSRKLRESLLETQSVMATVVATQTLAHVDGATDAIGHQSAIVAGSGQKVNVTATTANEANNEVNSTALAVSDNSIQGNTQAKQPLAIGWFAWIRLTMSLGFVVKSMCIMTNIFYQASPLPIIGDFQAKGDTGDADLAPYIALAYSGWQWCFYGIFAYMVTAKSGFLVLVYSNVIGATLGIYYVYSFVTISKNTSMVEKSIKYYYVLGCIVAVQFIAILTQQPVRALFFSGMISSAWSTITSCSLLATVPIVYETQSSSSLPFPLLVVGCMAGSLWIVCGIILWDPWITFPNLIALTVCVYALYLCYKFPAKDDSSAPMVNTDDCHAVRSSLDVEDASPLQRALKFVSGTSDSQTHLLQEDRSVAYGSTLGGTGGTGDSF